MSDPRGRHEQRLKRDPSPLIQQAYAVPHISADKANFHHHLAANRAHTVMLVECGIITPDVGGAILRALADLESGGADSVPIRPELNDLFTCTEVLLVQSLGEAVGGCLHTGRSRNDLSMALERMADRDAINHVVDELLQLRQTLLERAREHADTVFPGYTHHSQQAQPVTLGHFLLSHHDILARDGERLESAYARTNLCPLGGPRLPAPVFPSTGNGWRNCSDSMGSSRIRLTAVVRETSSSRWPRTWPSSAPTSAVSPKV